jgi:hypothetical protein
MTVDASLHRSWDRYGFFVLLPPMGTLWSMKNALEADRYRRQERWNTAGPSTPEPRRRYLDIHPPPEPTLYFELVVLHPWQLLPKPLTLAHSRNDVIDHFAPRIDGDSTRLYNVQDPSQMLSNIPFVSSRKPEERPNLFLLLIHSVQRIEVFKHRYSRAYQCMKQETREYLELACEAYDMLFKPLFPPNERQQTPSTKIGNLVGESSMPNDELSDPQTTTLSPSSSGARFPTGEQCI